jgi:hypothetical protein
MTNDPTPPAPSDPLRKAAQALCDYEDGAGGSMTQGSFLLVPSGIVNALRAALRASPPAPDREEGGLRRLRERVLAMRELHPEPVGRPPHDAKEGAYTAFTMALTEIDRAVALMRRAAPDAAENARLREELAETRTKLDDAELNGESIMECRGLLKERLGIERTFFDDCVRVAILRDSQAATHRRREARCGGRWAAGGAGNGAARPRAVGHASEELVGAA